VKKILHKQEIEDIIVGATLLGAGGGGSPKTGLLLLKDISEVTLFDLEEIPDDSHIAVVAGMGSPVVLSRIGWKGEEITALEKFLLLPSCLPIAVETVLFFTRATPSKGKDLPEL